MLLARAHFKQVQTNNNSNQHSKPSLRPFAGLSFKTENISVDRIPLPKGWEMISNTIDGKEEIFFRNFENDQNTRQDPRIPIKVHLEELHCQLTTEMISRLNNPSAYNPVIKFLPVFDSKSNVQKKLEMIDMVKYHMVKYFSFTINPLYKKSLKISCFRLNDPLRIFEIHFLSS